jgi:hypothetical protein
MKTIYKCILSAGLTLLMMSTTFAGQVQPALVDVDLENNFAGGDMVSARASKDDDVFIGCGIRNFDFDEGDPYAFGFCQAEDADGDRALCFTENPHLLDAMKALSDYSYITFSYTVETDEEGNESSTCTRIGNSTQSFYLSKTKENKVK